MQSVSAALGASRGSDHANPDDRRELIDLGLSAYGLLYLANGVSDSELPKALQPALARAHELAEEWQAEIAATRAPLGR